MTQGYGKLLRSISIILLIAMLLTSQAFTVFAAEISDSLEAAIQDAMQKQLAEEAAEEAAAGEDAEEAPEMTPELMELLFRLGEFDSFTEAEKETVRAFFGMEGNDADMTDALEQEANRQQMLAALPETARYEVQILDMQRQGKVYSTLTAEEKALILEYLAMEETDAAPIFAKLETLGYDLFTSMQIAGFTKGGVFTLQEALQLYGMYAERPERDANVKGFQRFAAAFDTDGQTLSIGINETEQDKLRREKAEYLSAEALAAAKQMLLKGYSAKEIQAAYAVAATYELNPAELLADKQDTAAAADEEEATFFSLFPIDASAFKTERKAQMEKAALVTDASVQMSGTQTTAAAETSIDYAAATEEVTATSAALYGEASASVRSVDEDADIHIEQPFSANITDRERINLNTGALQYTETLFSIPGINGDAMPLQVIYDSSESNLDEYTCTLSYIDYLDYYTAHERYAQTDEGTYVYYGSTGTKQIDSLQETYTTQEQIGVFDYTKHWTHYEEHYGIGAGWSFNIPSIDMTTDDNNRYASLYLPGKGKFSIYDTYVDDYSLSDMTLTSDKTYTSGGFTSDRKLTHADGSIYYFSAEGLLLAMSDRFGNTVTYAYTLVDDHYYPSRIVDANGGSTTFVYADSESNRTVTITAPDGRQTQLHVYKVYGVNNPDDTRLDSIVYPDGETIEFTYRTEIGFYYYGEYSPDTLDYILLEGVTYDTGMQLHYTYAEPTDLINTYGTMRLFRVTERYATKTGSETPLEKLTYTYTSSYADAGNFDNPSDGYTTTVTEQNPSGTKAVTYVFDCDHRCTEENTTVNGTLYQKVINTYDAYNLPTQVTTSTYGSATVTTIELYTHDKYGNTLTYISPKAGGVSTNTAYRTTYTYDTTYRLPLTVTYQQDASTTVKIENVLTSDKKNIAETKTYVNNVLKAKTAYTYDAKGRVLTETAYPNISVDSGIVTEYTYLGEYLASKTVKNVVGNDGVSADLTVSYTYDTMGRPLTETDAKGNTTTTAYDARGRVTSITYPDGSVTAYAYDLANNTTTVTSSGREAIVYDYDALGNLESTSYASGDNISAYTYDAFGRVTEESNAYGKTWYTYDALDRVTERKVGYSTSSILYRETYVYNDAFDSSTSLVTKTVHGDANAANIVTKTYTNKYGEVTKEDVGGAVTQYAYNYVGDLLRVYYDSTTLARYTYDYAGNVLTESNADGYTRRITYDAIGRKLSESGFNGYGTTYTYDNAGRLLTMTAPLGVTKYYYDANSNIIKQEQSSQVAYSSTVSWRTVEQSYDSMNRVTDIVNHVEGGNKQYTHYTYNLAGDMTDVYTGLSVPFAVANADSYSRVQYTYDNRGSNTAITDALGQTESYTYDVLGGLVSAVQRDGKITRYTYDALGNVLTDKVYANADAATALSEKTTVYTATGAVRSVTLDGSAVSYTYDGIGNILTETEGTTVKTYTYDTRGRKSGYTLTVDGTVISTATYTYDTSDRLVSVTEGGKTTTYTYDASGNRASQTVGEVTTTYTYNGANLVTEMVYSMLNAVEDPVSLGNTVYTYYADGNIHTKEETQFDTTVTTTYVYDGMGRLTSETVGEDVISYYYDASGNRTVMNNGGNITSYTYDKNNRLLTETTSGTTTAYTYDANGNTLTAGDKTYTYNARGQQIGYTDGTTTASYAYNPSGLRSAKTVGGSTKYFVYNGMQIVFEYADSVSDGTVYYYGLNRTHNSDGETYVYNAHGDTIQLVRYYEVAVSYTYDAFGNLTSQIGESNNPFLYCSEFFDNETQTYYLRARYYNPANGRFTQQDGWGYMDTSDPLSLNLYTYCVNNPVMYVDPSGKAGILAAFLLIGAAAITAMTLTSCDSNMSVEERRKEAYEELYSPDSHLYDWGSFKEEEAVELACRLVYNSTYKNPSGLRYEYGAFIYTMMAYNPETQKDEIRYYCSSVYSSADPQLIRYDPKEARVPKGATIVAFVHSHPFPKEISLFSMADLKPVDMYVVEECPCVYYLKAGALMYTDENPDIGYVVKYRNDEYHDKHAR